MQFRTRRVSLFYSTFRFLGESCHVFSSVFHLLGESLQLKSAILNKIGRRVNVRGGTWRFRIETLYLRTGASGLGRGIPQLASTRIL